MSDPSHFQTRISKKQPLWWGLLLWGGVGLLTILTFATMSLPHLGRDSPWARKVRSANNLKQIWLEIDGYARNHGGVYPDNLGTIYLGEDMNSIAFVSPESTDTPSTAPTTQAVAADLAAGRSCSYVYIGRGLSGNVPDKVVLAYEDPTIWPDGGNVLYADGSIEFEDRVTLRQINAQAASGNLPVTRPSAH